MQPDAEFGSVFRIKKFQSRYMNKLWIRFKKEIRDKYNHLYPIYDMQKVFYDDDFDIL